MTVRELAKRTDAEILTGDSGTDAEITEGYCCDLLSWAMAHGKKGMAWITVQTHMNVVAIAVMKGMTCVIAPEHAAFAGDVIAKAREEGIHLLSTKYNAFEIARLF